MKIWLLKVWGKQINKVYWAACVFYFRDTVINEPPWTISVAQGILITARAQLPILSMVVRCHHPYSPASLNQLTSPKLVGETPTFHFAQLSSSCGLGGFTELFQRVADDLGQPCSHIRQLAGCWPEWQEQGSHKTLIIQRTRRNFFFPFEK